ncbi:MAG: hypothetical protein HY744_25755 [Deltaproteobacteria bacterium]|nr:hypothetical protein [Deltaproteobacteria bacterium]
MRPRIANLATLPVALFGVALGSCEVDISLGSDLPASGDAGQGGQGGHVKPPPPCEGKKCGQQCHLEPEAPPGLVCNLKGECVVGPVPCEPPPKYCGLRPCGAPCKPCAEPEKCPWPDQPHFCQHEGECLPEPPKICPPTPCGQAKCDPGLQYCCNPSCSLCVPFGAECMQLECGPGSTLCGPTTCPPKTYCCDPMCGICAVPGEPCPSKGCAEPWQVCGENACLPDTVCCNPLCGVCTAPGKDCPPHKCPGEKPSCGPTNCHKDEQCCNPQCGICVPPGLACAADAKCPWPPP